MFENKDFDSIMEEMLSQVSDKLDKREGSVIYDAIAPMAMELAQAYIDMDMIVNEVYADTASYNDLKSEGNPNCVLTNATGELLNYKYGNISMISIEANLTKIEHGLIVGTGIYAPVRNIYLSLTMIDGTNVPMLLSTLGELSVYYPYQNHTSVARIDGCFSYICA